MPPFCGTAWRARSVRDLMRKYVQREVSEVACTSVASVVGLDGPRPEDYRKPALLLVSRARALRDRKVRHHAAVRINQRVCKVGKKKTYSP
jgi:hypothetical protein